jgi:hypothetical protein
MSDQPLVTRLVRARDLTPGSVIIRDHPEQLTILNVETHPLMIGREQSTTGIAVDETGEQVELCWADWALVRLVVTTVPPGPRIPDGVIACSPAGRLHQLPPEDIAVIEEFAELLTDRPAVWCPECRRMAVKPDQHKCSKEQS